MNRFASSIAVAALSLAALTGVAMAQTTTFATADADHNGEVSMPELTVVMASVTEDEFNSADADKSGGLNEAEFNSIVGGAASLTESTPANTGGGASGDTQTTDNN